MKHKENAIPHYSFHHKRKPSCSFQLISFEIMLAVLLILHDDDNDDEMMKKYHFSTVALFYQNEEKKLQPVC